MKLSTLATVVDGLIALAIIAASVVLLALGKIDGQTALGLFGVAVVLVGGSAKALLALHVPAPTQTVTAPPPATHETHDVVPPAVAQP